MIGFGSPMFNLPIFCFFSLPSVAVGACRLTRTISYFHFPPSANNGSVALVIAGRILRRLYQSGMQFMV